MRSSIRSIVNEVIDLCNHGHESVNRLDQNLKRQMRVIREYCETPIHQTLWGHGKGPVNQGAQ
jgi:hypothetical protein